MFQRKQAFVVSTEGVVSIWVVKGCASGELAEERKKDTEMRRAHARQWEGSGLRGWGQVD